MRSLSTTTNEFALTRDGGRHAHAGRGHVLFWGTTERWRLARPGRDSGRDARAAKGRATLCGPFPLSARLTTAGENATIGAPFHSGIQPMPIEKADIVAHFTKRFGQSPRWVVRPQAGSI